MKEQFKDCRRCRTANVSQNMGAVPTQIITDDSLLNISTMPKQTVLNTKTRGHFSLSSMRHFSFWSARDFQREDWKVKQRSGVYASICQGDGFPFWQTLSVVPSRVSVISHYSPYLSPVTKKVTVAQKILHQRQRQLYTGEDWMRLSSERPG